MIAQQPVIHKPPFTSLATVSRRFAMISSKAEHLSSQRLGDYFPVNFLSEGRAGYLPAFLAAGFLGAVFLAMTGLAEALGAVLATDFLGAAAFFTGEAFFFGGSFSVVFLEVCIVFAMPS